MRDLPAPASADLVAAGAPQPDPGVRVSPDLVAMATHGLPGGAAPKRVLVIGAGMAGLVAAYELAGRGHQVTVLEAQHRVGGRVHTLRGFAPGLYAEAGAMRVPRVHDLTLEYCHRFGLELRPFVMDNPHTLAYIQGKRLTMGELNADPDLLDFDLAPHERGRTYADLWREATAEIHELYAQEGEHALDRLCAEYDRYSIRAFLRERGFSTGAIELYGIMSFREANLNAAVIEQFREIIGRAFEDMQEITGGSDLLPTAFYREIKDHVRFGHEVHAIEQDDREVRLHVRTTTGQTTLTADYAICTVPFSVLRDIEISPAFSRGKQRAIRELHYNASTKILFQVRRRFWERTDRIVGGTTVTDLPIRRICYPSHSDPREDRAILLASYTWGQDALRWGAMSEQRRIQQALEDVAKVHPEINDTFEFGVSHSWYDDPWAAGAFALFEPQQQSGLHEDILKPEGRIHFAGEHCSLWHAWIEGALESGLRAATAVHESAE
ncbi:putative L-amino-acid oxidase YobN [Acrocarpospora phusangensis]|uniref:L-amino-acid oxidase YobN n=1 Tax=Acrocarpospora phusangensis TaxID=1070424 RepID=A0A919QBM6_9ACTN|nr:flavin monoamine oxidase family protein [Acrocarpospora phusangensis]GIH24418.1 putative L-amino-acid oxidase YobN [Acrocarpospora phusangensis]